MGDHVWGYTLYVMLLIRHIYILWVIITCLNIKIPTEPCIHRPICISSPSHYYTRSILQHIYSTHKCYDLAVGQPHNLNAFSMGAARMAKLVSQWPTWADNSSVRASPARMSPTANHPYIDPAPLFIHPNTHIQRKGYLFTPRAPLRTLSPALIVSLRCQKCQYPTPGWLDSHWRILSSPAIHVSGGGPDPLRKQSAPKKHPPIIKMEKLICHWWSKRQYGHLSQQADKRQMD